MTLSPRLQVAAHIAAALATAPATEELPAGLDRAPRHIASHALEIADALLAQAPQEWDAVTNPGDEKAIDNARRG